MNITKFPDANDLLQQLSEGKTTSENLVNEHIERLRESQPVLNAATAIFSEEAKAESKNPKPVALSGLPVTVKECFSYAGQEITLGSIRMIPIRTGNNAAIVQKLKDAGAIVIARTNTADF